MVGGSANLGCNLFYAGAYGKAELQYRYPSGRVTFSGAIGVQYKLLASTKKLVICSGENVLYSNDGMSLGDMVIDNEDLNNMDYELIEPEEYDQVEPNASKVASEKYHKDGTSVMTVSDNCYEYLDMRCNI